MSRRYKKGEEVPIKILCERVSELVKAITAGDSSKSLLREFDMRIPSEVDRDADLVLSEISRRLMAYEAGERSN